MAAERKGDVGSKLRAARERRGLSLRQIAAQTKISVGVLEALERNDISRLPGGIFSRAFVRAYAVEVGLDPEKTVRDFLGEFPDGVGATQVDHRASERIEFAEPTGLSRLGELARLNTGRLAVASVVLMV